MSSTVVTREEALGLPNGFAVEPQGPASTTRLASSLQSRKMVTVIATGPWRIQLRVGQLVSCLSGRPGARLRILDFLE